MMIENRLILPLLMLAFLGELSSAIAIETAPKRFVPAALARFELVLGRLQLSSEHYRIGAAHERVQLENGKERSRSIAISTMRGKPTLQFRDFGGEEDVALSFKADRQVDLLLVSGEGKERKKMTYHQPIVGPVHLKVESVDGGETIELQSQSLWHLALENRQAFATHLEPCLNRLDPSWQISRSAEAIQKLMRETSPSTEGVSIESLIVQLDADFAAERDAALKQLESMGIAAEPRLRQCLSAELTDQQKTSIHRLLGTLQPMGNDTPVRVALWLSAPSNR